MPIWGWVLTAVGIIIFIPIKIKLTKKFLEGQKKKDSEEMLDD